MPVNSFVLKTWPLSSKATKPVLVDGSNPMNLIASPILCDRIKLNQIMKRVTELNDLEFISNVISSLAWPVSILAIVWILKDHLINAISSIKNLKYKDVELSFSNELSKIEG